MLVFGEPMLPGLNIGRGISGCRSVILPVSYLRHTDRGSYHLIWMTALPNKSPSHNSNNTTGILGRKAKLARTCYRSNRSCELGLYSVPCGRISTRYSWSNTDNSFWLVFGTKRNFFKEFSELSKGYIG